MVSFDEECSHYEAVVCAAGQGAPSVSERKPPPSGRVPASGVVEVSSPLQLRAKQPNTYDASTPLQRRATLLPSGSVTAGATTSVQ